MLHRLSAISQSGSGGSSRNKLVFCNTAWGGKCPGTYHLVFPATDILGKGRCKESKQLALKVHDESVARPAREMLLTSAQAVLSVRGSQPLVPPQSEETVVAMENQRMMLWDPHPACASFCRGVSVCEVDQTAPRMKKRKEKNHNTLQTFPFSVK